MSKGILIFAFDNEKIKYTSMADWSANRIRNILNLPCTVVTNQPIKLEHADVIVVSDPESNGKRWFDDFGDNVSWKNKNRHDAYTLSPYDETILLDADYVVNSTMLLNCFAISEDIVPMGTAFDVTGLDTYDSLNKFGAHKFPMSWATVVYFKKSANAQSVFSMIKLIQDNWEFYRHLYKINKTQYRNDFALSIAMNTVYGNLAQWPVLPWHMASIDPAHHLFQTQTGFDVIFSNRTNNVKRIQVDNMDFHAMGKNKLGDIIENT